MGIKVVIADDNLIAREGIERILAVAPEWRSSPRSATSRAAAAAVDRERPDVVLTDIRMPPSLSDEGIRFANRLRETHPGIGVIVLSQYDEPRYALTLIELGSDGRGYLLKDRSTTARSSPRDRGGRRGRRGDRPEAGRRARRGKAARGRLAARRS